MGFDLKGAIGSIAPTLATMLGGPLAGAAVSALTGAFGLTSTGDQSKDLGAISDVVQNGAMTPDMISQVRAADQKHLEIIGQQGVDLAKLNADHEAAMAQISVGDVASARQREVAVKDSTPRVLAYTLIGGFLSLSLLQLIALMFFPVQAAAIPQSGWLLIGQISGYLANEAKMAGSYYFGTSAGSDKKTDMLAKAQPISD